MDVCIFVFLIPYEEEFTMVYADSIPVRAHLYDSVCTHLTIISANISGWSAQEV